MTPLGISHLAPPYVLAARFGSISCLMIVEIRETRSCDKASKLSLVYIFQYYFSSIIVSAHDDAGRHFLHVILVRKARSFSLALLVLVLLVQKQVIGPMSSGL